MKLTCPMQYPAMWVVLGLLGFVLILLGVHVGFVGVCIESTRLLVGNMLVSVK